MNTTLKVNRKQVASIVDATFPEYTGRKFRVIIEAEIGFYNTNWSGGTKSEYRCVQADGNVADLPEYAPWANPVEGKRVALPEGAVVVEHTYFCGEDAGIRIHISEASARKLLG